MSLIKTNINGLARLCTLISISYPLLLFCLFFAIFFNEFRNASSRCYLFVLRECQVCLTTDHQRSGIVAWNSEEKVETYLLENTEDISQVPLVHLE